MPDDALVLGRAACLDAGIGDERSVFGDAGVFFVANRVLVQRAGRKVVMDIDGQPREFALGDIDRARLVPEV